MIFQSFFTSLFEIFKAAFSSFSPDTNLFQACFLGILVFGSIKIISSLLKEGQ